MLLKKAKLKPPVIEIKNVSNEKIVFKCKYAWAICLNGCRESKLSFFFLPNNLLNQEKIKKIIPNIFFSRPKDNPKFSHSPIRDYQKEDIKILSQKQHGAIFSEMRTGKTPIALFVWNQWKTKNLLIIVPVIVQCHWQNSVAEWLNKPAYVITYLEKKNRLVFYKKLQEEDDWIVIISKDTFKLDIQEIKELKKNKNFFQECCVIIDEAHFLRNHDSQQSKSIYTLQPAIHKLILTGTPIVNNYSDFFGILKFFFPEKYPSFREFLREYFQILRIKIKKNGRVFSIEKAKGFRNKEKQQELFQEINSFSVNRKQKDVLSWLPNIIYQREYLLMDDEQQEIYNQIIKKNFKKDPSFTELEIFVKLKTTTLFPKLMGSKKNGVKFDYIINFLKEKVDTHSIIVFSTRSSTFLIPLAKELNEKKKIEVQLITGKTSNNEKNKIIENFQKKNNKVLFCNIQATNLGIELSQADIIIFADRSYSPADNEQAEARFISPTAKKKNTKAKLIIDLICKGSIDEKIHKLLKNKKKNITIADILSA